MKYECELIKEITEKDSTLDPKKEAETKEAKELETLYFTVPDDRQHELDKKIALNKWRGACTTSCDLINYIHNGPENNEIEVYYKKEATLKLLNMNVSCDHYDIACMRCVPACPKITEVLNRVITYGVIC